MKTSLVALAFASILSTVLFAEEQPKTPQVEAMIDAVKSGDKAAVQALLTRDSNLSNAVEFRGNAKATFYWSWSALMIAAQLGHTEICKSLLDSGAKTTSSDHRNNGPLHFAARNGHVEIAKYLLARGADPNRANSGGDTPLNFAANEGHLEIVDALLEKGAKPNTQNVHGDTALHLAAEGGFVGAVRLLLAGKADPNAKNSYDQTPLHCVAACGHEWGYTWSRGFNVWHSGLFSAHEKLEHPQDYDWAAKRLLDAGAHMTATKDRQEKPLHIAAKYGSIKMVKMFLDAGERFDVVDLLGKSPMINAKEHRHPEIVNLFVDLQKSSAKQ